MACENLSDEVKETLLVISQLQYEIMRCESKRSKKKIEQRLNDVIKKVVDLMNG